MMIETISAIGSKTDYLMVRKNTSMRYVITKPQTSARNGTILLLQGYGKQVEDYDPTIHKLATRGFFVICPDFIGQGKSDKLRGDKVGGHATDYRKFIDDLDILFSKIILEELPAPYYILGDDMGAIIALTAHDLFANKIRRQILVSPLLTPNNHSYNNLFHSFCRLLSDCGLGRLKTTSPFLLAKQSHSITHQEKILPLNRSYKPIYPTFGWHATMLDAIGYIHSSSYIDNMTIPTLIYLPNQDNNANSKNCHDWVSRLRMAQLIDLRGAPHDILASEDKFAKQFWQGFSAFIPGTSFIPSFKEDSESHERSTSLHPIINNDKIIQVSTA